METFVVRRSGPGRCAVCHGALGGPGATTECGACGCSLHRECLADVRRCPTIGCRGTFVATEGAVVAVAPTTVLPPAPRRVRGGWRLAGKLLWPLLVPHVWVGLALVGVASSGAPGAVVGAAFWNALVALFLYLTWWPPLRTWLLVRDGHEAPAMITATRREGGRAPTFYAKVRYVDPGTGKEVVQEIRLAEERFARARALEEEGARVSVLVDPSRSGRAVVFELTGEELA